MPVVRTGILPEPGSCMGVSLNFSRIWLEAARPKTLPAAVAPVIAASALAFHYGSLVPWIAGICLGFALLIQIGTNFANDYFDCLKGADAGDRVGPRRAVASGLVAPGTMRAAAFSVFAGAFVLGCALIPVGGWPMLIVGVASILCGLAYTAGPVPLAYVGLGDLFVFLFFGLVAVTVTFWLQTGAITPAAWWAATGIGALAVNILVANNHRDVKSDARAGKRTLAVRFGRGFARIQFSVGMLVAGLAPVGMWLTGECGPWATLPLLLVPYGWRLHRRIRGAETAGEHIAVLAGSGRLLALYALLLSLGLVLEGFGVGMD